MPDLYRTRRTEFRAADPAEGQPMLIEGYFVVFQDANDLKILEL